ncbi:MAG TPA: biotin--[acetyl-CoA-carboxylase] ligase [Candidatus Omnitrophota bacterium]|nr:biotin--[acetyl-CoA-carboxylase] ligase [Candidatus Omnitrophota bacterium]HPD84668.1 biotin--[acetyl-CoA-carboxylase] ligase [Candidatus Omnitrophota bacterium]HRZ03526.1 biotin--[acetyl-CoA-carboxylase] ligase [Candidatus Omnitrophota bacterium]
MQEKIIDFLKKADGFISGEDISGALNISRAAIWKYIQELKKEGYEIVAVPHLGYRLESSPDKLFPHEIQFGLSTKVVGKKIVAYDSLDSTMDIAFDLGMHNAPEGTVVLAEGQSRGRGRLGRNWSSPKGKGIYLSIILRPLSSPSEVSRLTLLTAVAVSEAIKQVTGVSALIKWPNDLLVDDKKIAGILTELNAEVDRVKFVVIGIGINVNTRPDALPEGATSLRGILQGPVSRVELTKEILRQVERRYGELNKHGFAAIAQCWKGLSVTLNKRIKITDPGGMIEGVAVDIDKDGGLLIRKDSGVVVKKTAGDVVRVKS